METETQRKKTNEPGKNFWQQEKHAKLYSD